MLKCDNVCDGLRNEVDAQELMIKQPGKIPLCTLRTISLAAVMSRVIIRIDGSCFDLRNFINSAAISLRVFPSIINPYAKR